MANKSSETMTVTDERVRYIFNQMSEEYDDLRDLWYAWLFSRLHFLISKHVIAQWEPTPRKVLDVGCGTGLQSFLYALSGSEVTGIDISDELVGVARRKAEFFRKEFPCSLFEPHFPFVSRYDRRVAALLSPKFESLAYTPPIFGCADAVQLPYEDNSFDHVSCCGSTLNFIDNYQKALKEISRVLKPGGSFALEVDAKYNFDLLWTVLDPVLFGAMHFETTLQEALGALFSSPKAHIAVQYPFGNDENPVYMDLRLFTRKGLVEDLAACSLKSEQVFSIHSITNLIPSTFLDDANPSGKLVRLFAVLAWIEERLFFYVPGCSVVIFGRKPRPLDNAIAPSSEDAPRTTSTSQ